MNLNDILNPSNDYIAQNKPTGLDMDRISEIVLRMKAASSEATNAQEHEDNWRKLIESLIDFDSLAWQALNVAYDVYGIHNGMDLMMLQGNRTRYDSFIRTIQSFYDGFLLGAQFQKLGGHRDG